MNKFNSNQEKIFLDSSLVQLANLIPGYVFWKDLEGRFLGSNEAHLKALGLNKIDQLVGKDDFDFYPKDVAETCRKYDKMATSEKQVIKLGEEVRNKSGFEEIWVTSKAPLYNAEGEIIGVIGVSLDITASKKNEMLEKKQKLEQEKIEKEKALLETALMQKTLEEKKLLSKLAAQVAHDVRSPLSALMIVTENDLSNVPEHTRILVRDAISQIRDIINNLDPKAFQKEKALTQIAVLIDLILSERRVAFKDKNVLIECQFSTEAYHLFVETIPTEMKRVITNLINNAVDALSPDKQGRVTILLEREEANRYLVKNFGTSKSTKIYSITR
jgi:PAS domain S-box-containing protein